MGNTESGESSELDIIDESNDYGIPISNTGSFQNTMEQLVQ